MQSPGLLQVEGASHPQSYLQPAGSGLRSISRAPAPGHWQDRSQGSSRKWSRPTQPILTLGKEEPLELLPHRKTKTKISRESLTPDFPYQAKGVAKVALATQTELLVRPVPKLVLEKCV
jgi:hypothetical protein